eukprot:TRINITY_DN60693_c1_g2_i6.p2 TRINITY_DN60693_c1_g2~~TRINITY_DN60693_c1_g2_i6.p2  ORF type:complete len:375 (-),score=66.16 TRINITY_DN60693_c1_g2_i6:6-1106(-)
MGSTTENSAFQISKNPWDKSRVPGGSSGGSASAVAAGQVVCALGSDTGGSIRQPAHFCGCVGLKPSYGLVSRFGLIAYASSLDVIGPMTNSVKDAAFILDAIVGKDDQDATSRMSTANFSQHLLPAEQLDQQPLKGKKIGIIEETLGEGVDGKVENTLKEAAKKMARLGAQVEYFSMSSFGVGLPAYYIIATSEASSNLSRYDGVRYGNQREGEDLAAMYKESRGVGLSDEVKRRILMGTYTLSAGYYDAYYKKAQQVRKLVKQQLNEALNKFDVLLTPPAPTLAVKIGESLKDPLQMYKGDLMTVNINLAGLPSLVVPAEIVKSEENIDLPCGIQFIGKEMCEGELLFVAHVFETLSPCQKLVPC